MSTLSDPLKQTSMLSIYNDQPHANYHTAREPSAHHDASMTVAPAPSSSAESAARPSAAPYLVSYVTCISLRMGRTHGCHGMISFSLPLRDGGGTRFKLGKLIVEPPRGVHEPNRRVPLKNDDDVTRLGECKGLGVEGCDNSLDGDVGGADWDSP